LLNIINYIINITRLLDQHSFTNPFDLFY